MSDKPRSRYRGPAIRLIFADPLTPGVAIVNSVVVVADT